MQRALMLLTLALASAGCGGTTEPGATGIFGYDRSQPLNVTLTPSSSTAFATVHAITYASPGGGQVTGFIAVPTAAGKHPGVVLLHGLPGTAGGAMSFEGMGLAQRGAVVLAIDAPWVRRGGFPDLTVRDSVEQVQLMQDLQRAVDVLVARADVDPARIAYDGGSYGGAMGTLFAGIEPRLKAAALFVPDGGLVAHFTSQDGSPSGSLAVKSLPDQQRWLEAMSPIEPILFIGQARCALLFQNGLQDQLVENDDAEALHAAAPPGSIILWYNGDHGLTAAAVTERRAWLAARIGTSP